MRLSLRSPRTSHRARPHKRPGRRPPRPSERARTAGVRVGRPTGPAQVAARRRVVRRVALGLALVIVVAAGLGWLGLASPWLRAQEVRVVGAGPAEQGEIERMTEPYMGEPLLKVDTHALQAEVSDLRPILRADVSREWPHRLSIVVTSRTPVAAVKNPRGDLELMDASGVVYASVGEAPADVPTVSLAHADDPREAGAAASVISVLEPGQRAALTDLRVVSPDDVRFRLDGVDVLWGGPADGKVKAAVLAALAGRDGLGSINVSAPHSPVTAVKAVPSPSTQRSG